MGNEPHSEREDAPPAHRPACTSQRARPAHRPARYVQRVEMHALRDLGTYATGVLRAGDFYPKAHSQRVPSKTRVPLACPLQYATASVWVTAERGFTLFEGYCVFCPAILEKCPQNGWGLERGFGWLLPRLQEAGKEESPEKTHKGSRRLPRTRKGDRRNGKGPYAPGARSASGATRTRTGHR